LNEDNFFGKHGIFVKVFNGNVNTALTQLKRKVNSEGMNKELRKRECFETNTAKRRRKLAEAKIRWQKKQDLISELPKPKRKLKRKQLRQQQMQQQNQQQNLKINNQEIF
jgi:ribosomal protein S21